MAGKPMFGKRLTPAEIRERHRLRKQGLLPPVASKSEQRKRDSARRRARYAASVGKSVEDLRACMTKEGTELLTATAIEILEESQPMTLRQLYYQCVVRNVCEKTDRAYEHLGDIIVRARREGRVPFDWIVDNTRGVSAPLVFGTIGDALQDTADSYRMEFWSQQKDNVQIWLEKDALVGVVDPLVRRYQVPLVAARGYPSWSLAHESANWINSADGETFVYHLGDYDPSGEDAANFAERTLDELTFMPIHFERVAVTPEQIAEYKLPTRPTKKTDSRAKAFGSDESVELDAFTPNQLRALVEEVINRHMSLDRLADLESEEAANRAKIAKLVKRWQKR